jgi:ABC-type amino acid transport substrate-binding protein
MHMLAVRPWSARFYWSNAMLAKPMKDHVFARHMALRLVLAGAALVSGFAASAESLKVGYFELPPHVVTDKAGVAGGPAVEFFKAIASKMGVKDVTFQAMPLSRLNLSMESGELDAALFVSHTAERATKFYYPAKSYFSPQPGIVVPVGSPITQIKSADDLKALKIGAMQSMALSPSMRQPGLNIEYIPGADADARNVQKLANGRLDAAYSSDLSVLMYVAKSQGVDKAVRPLALPDPVVSVYTMFSKAKGAALGAKYVEALEAVIKEKGDYAKAFLK